MMYWLNSVHHKLLDILFPPRTDEVVIRDCSLDDFLTLVAPKLVPETRPGTVALLPFSAPIVRSMLHEAKYHGNEHAFRLLGAVLAEYLRDCDDVGFTKPNIIIVPVPLGKGRRKKRGFNQTEEIASRAAKLLGGAVSVNTTLLIRTRETVSQVSLAREKREENMRGAFRVAPGAAQHISNSSAYVVLDDVITTGATLQAAIDALKKAGATRIIPLALAH